ncbi:MAG: pro-sigmaK processing inhibitor BofA family protein [Clostridia bacterium]|nr:pro-sigmaK processing inhibitor BofA family protein [Clostridia bacterium]
MPWALVLSFALGICLMYIIGWLLLVPMRFMWRMMAGSLLGALLLWLVNQFYPITGFAVALNPFSALAVGLMGLPGFGLVVALNFLL